jgi:hypothetical protein
MRPWRARRAGTNLDHTTGMPGTGLTEECRGRPILICQPWSRTGENPPYGILGGKMETSASFEVRSAPPTRLSTKAVAGRGVTSIAIRWVTGRCRSVSVRLRAVRIELRDRNSSWLPTVWPEPGTLRPRFPGAVCALPGSHVSGRPGPLRHGRRAFTIRLRAVAPRQSRNAARTNTSINVCSASGGKCSPYRGRI